MKPSARFTPSLGRLSPHVRTTFKSLAALGIVLSTPLARGAVDTWVGNASADLSGANWNTSSTTTTGDSWIFGPAGTAGATLNNGLTSFSVAGITFNAGGSAYTIGGNAITLTSDITDNYVGTETLNFNISTTAVRTMTMATGGTLTLGGNISGAAGGLTAAGAGTLVLTGTNTYTGVTTVNGLLKINGSGSINGGASTSTISVGSGAAGTVQYDSTGTSTFYSMSLGTGAANGTFNQTAGTVNVTTSLVMNNALGRSGFYNLSGGTLAVTGTVNVGTRAGASTFTLSGSGNLTAGTIMVAGTSSGNSNSTGTFTQTSGTAKATSLILGQGGDSGSHVATYTLGNGTAGSGILTVGGVFAGVATGTGVNTSTFNFAGGTLQASASTTTFMQGVTIANMQNGGATVDTNGFNITIAQPLLHYATATTDSLTKVGAGTLTLSGNNTYSGGTVISSGTLLLGNVNALGATTGALTLNAGTLDLNGNSVAVGLLSGSSGALITTSSNASIALTANSASSGTYAGVIANGSGSVGLTKQGAGTLTLSGNNTYSGGTIISSGSLAVGNANALGATSGNITASGGTLDLGGYSLTSSGTVSFQGGTVSNGLLTNNTVAYDGQSGTVSAALAGSAGLNKTGAGTLTLSSTSNTFSGAINVNAGTLVLTNTTAQVGGAFKVLGGANTINLNNGATLGIGQNSSGGYGQIFTVASSLAVTGTATINVYSAGGNSSPKFTFSSLSLADGSLLNVSDTSTATARLGATTTTLNGNVTIRDQAGTNGSNGGRMELNAITVGNSVATSSTSTLTVDGGNLFGAIAGAITNNATDGTKVLALVKSGTGNLTLSGGDTFTGNTTLTSGSLILKNTNALMNSTLVHNGTGTLVFDSTIASFILGGLSGNQNIALMNNAATPAAIGLTVGYNGSSNIYSGVLSGAGSLTKSGTGTLTLSGSNSYSGGTTLSAGTLNYGNLNALGSNTVTFSAASSTLQAGVSGTLANNLVGGGVFDTQGYSTTMGGTINTGASNFTKIGSGTLAIAAANGLNTNYLTVGNGILAVTGTGSITANGGFIGSTGTSATLQYDSTATSSFGATTALTLGAGSNGAGTVNQTAGQINVMNLSMGNGIGSGAGTYNLSGGTLALSGTAWVGYRGATGTINLSGSGNLTAGTLVVATVNSGGISTGVINQTGGTATATSLILAQGGADNATRTATYTLGSGTAGSGILNVGSISSVASTGGGTNASTFNFAGGTLQASADTTTFMQGLTTANVKNGGATIDTNGHNVTIAQSLLHYAGATTDTLTKAGDGTLTLSGNSTYSGATNVTAGTLTVNGSLGNTTTTVNANATLNGSGSVNGNVAISGAIGGSLAFNSDLTVNNTGSLSGAHSFGGNIALNNSTVSNVTSDITVIGGKTINGIGGTVGALTALSGATVAPGGSAATGDFGVLSLASFNLNSGAHLALDINGLTAGTNADEIITGGLTLGGDLTLTFGSNYATPGASDTIALILNTGDSSINNTFSDITIVDLSGTHHYAGDQGTILSINNQEFSLSYTAGSDNNDLELMAVPEPSTWAMVVGGLGMLTCLRRFRRTV